MDQTSQDLTPRHDRMLRELNGPSRLTPKRRTPTGSEISVVTAVGTLFTICFVGLLWLQLGTQFAATGASPVQAMTDVTPASALLDSSVPAAAEVLRQSVDDGNSVPPATF